jgi:hypothetical protein
MWSQIPLAVASVFWIPVILSVGLEVFREAQTGFTAELAIWTTYAARVWNSVILVLMLAEVQGFSIVRTIVELIGHWCGAVVYIAAVNFLGRVLGLM